MLLGLLAGATLAKGSALKGVAMTLLGLLLGLVGTDVNTGNERFTFGAAGAVGRARAGGRVARAVRHRRVPEQRQRDRPPATPARAAAAARPAAHRADLRQALPPILRGTVIGSLCSLIPGTGPTIASFIAYAAEKRISRTPERFGRGAIEGVAAPEASTHSAVQGDFIPTMSLGIPGDAVMALLLGALMIQGIQPGPRLIVGAAGHLLGPDRLVLDRQHHPGGAERADDRRVGEAAERALPLPVSRGAVLRVHRRVRSAQRDVRRGRHAGVRRRSASCCCSWASSRRRSCWASCWARGWRRTSAAPCCCRAASLATFVDRPISAVFVGLSVLLLLAQAYAALRRARAPIRIPETAFD